MMKSKRNLQLKIVLCRFNWRRSKKNNVGYLTKNCNRNKNSSLRKSSMLACKKKLMNNEK